MPHNKILYLNKNLSQFIIRQAVLAMIWLTVKQIIQSMYLEEFLADLNFHKDSNSIFLSIISINGRKFTQNQCIRRCLDMDTH